MKESEQEHDIVPTYIAICETCGAPVHPIVGPDGDWWVHS